MIRCLHEQVQSNFIVFFGCDYIVLIFRKIMASSLVTRKLLKDACQVQVYAARYFQFLNEINLLVKNEFIFYLYIYLGLGQALACQGQALRLGQARGVRPSIRFLAPPGPPPSY